MKRTEIHKILIIMVIIIFFSLIGEVNAVTWVDADDWSNNESDYSYQREFSDEDCNLNDNTHKNVKKADYCMKYRVMTYAKNATKQWLHIASIKNFNKDKILNNAYLGIKTKGVYCGQHNEETFEDIQAGFLNWDICIVGDETESRARRLSWRGISI